VILSCVLAILPVEKNLAKQSRDKSVTQRAEEAAADAAGPDNAQ
jgi:hypothetical protein